jgi:hypothetical protein
MHSTEDEKKSPYKHQRMNQRPLEQYTKPSRINASRTLLRDAVEGTVDGVDTATERCKAPLSIPRSPMALNASRIKSATDAGAGTGKETGTGTGREAGMRTERGAGTTKAGGTGMATAAMVAVTVGADVIPAAGAEAAAAAAASGSIKVDRRSNHRPQQNLISPSDSTVPDLLTCAARSSTVAVFPFDAVRVERAVLTLCHTSSLTPDRSQGTSCPAAIRPANELSTLARRIANFAHKPPISVPDTKQSSKLCWLLASGGRCDCGSGRGGGDDGIHDVVERDDDEDDDDDDDDDEEEEDDDDDEEEEEEETKEQEEEDVVGSMSF